MKLPRLFLANNRRPWALRLRASNWFTVFVVTFAVFTDIFLYGVIVPVIPFALQQRAHVEAGRVQYWISVLLAVYGAGLLVFSPICGWFSDTISMRRLPLLLGLAALLGATIMLNVATSVAVFIIGRLLQGISAAVVWVVGLALLADTVPREMLAQYMGYVSLGMTSGFLLGPLLGGVLYQRTGYNGVWALCYAFIGVDIALRLVLIEKKDAKRWIDDTNEEATTARESTVEANNVEEQEKEAANPPLACAQNPDSNLEGVMTDGSNLPVPLETMAGSSSPQTSLKVIRKLPAIISLLASRRLLAALFSCAVQAILIASFDSVLPLFVLETFGWDSLDSGVLYLAIVIPTLLSPVTGHLGDKYGGRWFAASGFLLACPFFVLLRLVTYNSLSQKVLLVALLVLIGLALTLSFPVIMAEITHIVSDKELSKPPGTFGKGGAYAQAYGLFNMAFALGTLVGPIWGGMIRQNYGWATMSWTLGLLSGVTTVPCAIWVDGSIRKKKMKNRANTVGQNV